MNIRMKKLRILTSLTVLSFFISSCGTRTNPDLRKAYSYNQESIKAYKYGYRETAIKNLKKSLSFYIKYDNIPKEVDILLLLAKIDKKDSKRYIKLAKSFIDNVDKKRQENIIFTSAILSKDVKSMKTLSKKGISRKIRALSKIYLYKWTKDKKYIDNFDYNKEDYIYSFYLYEKSKKLFKKEKIKALEKALEIDKKFQISRFIKRDLKALYNAYKHIDKQKSLQLKYRVGFMSD